MSRPGAPLLALGLLTTGAGCPADVTLDTATSSDTTGTSTGATSGATPPTTSVGPESSTTADPPASSTGASTGSGDVPLDGSTTDAASTSTDGTTGAASTSDASTSGSGSTGDASTSGSGSTGDASTSGSGSTGDASTSGAASSTGDTSTGDASSGGESSSGGDDTTGGEAELEVFPVCCDPGCSATLLQSSTGNVTLQHGGARFMSRDETRGLVLWDATTLAPLLHVDAVDGAALVGDTLAYRRAGELHIVDALDLAELGVCPAGEVHGIALDESYVWTAGPQGLEVLELDCTPRWSVAGDLGAAKALASPDALHVHEADLAPQEVLHFDAADGSFEAAPFLGAFGGWFADVPRYWAVQGNAYRVYDLDNAILGLEIGAPEYGWGTRIAVDGELRDVYSDETLGVGWFALFSGPAVVTHHLGAWHLARLDQQPMTKSPLALPEGIGGAAAFAWKDSAWVIDGGDGRIGDHLGRRATVGRIKRAHGSVAGRVAAHVLQQELRLFDIDGDACTATAHPPIPNTSTLLKMSGDGTLLLSREQWKNPNSMSDPNGYAGTRFYALPGGEKLAESSPYIKTLGILDYEVADDASGWAYVYQYFHYDYTASSFPFGTSYVTDAGNLPPKLSPDGTHLVHSNAGDVGLKDWSGQFAYIRAPQELVGAFEGIPHGFIDDQHILVGRYTAPDVFVETQIVGLDGALVQTTTLPDLRAIQRFGTGELLGVAHGTGDAAIYDPFTGEVLWTAPPDTEAVVAGPDHVVLNDGARLELYRWR